MNHEYVYIYICTGSKLWFFSAQAQLKSMDGYPLAAVETPRKLSSKKRSNEGMEQGLNRSCQSTLSWAVTCGTCSTGLGFTKEWRYEANSVLCGFWQLNQKTVSCQLLQITLQGTLRNETRSPQNALKALATPVCLHCATPADGRRSGAAPLWYPKEAQKLVPASSQNTSRKRKQQAKRNLARKRQSQESELPQVYQSLNAVRGLDHRASRFRLAYT